MGYAEHLISSSICNFPITYTVKASNSNTNPFIGLNGMAILLESLKVSLGMNAVIFWKSLIISTFEYIRRNFLSSDDLPGTTGIWI